MNIDITPEEFEAAVNDIEADWQQFLANGGQAWIDSWEAALSQEDY